MSSILNILSSVGFNWHVALANFINFLIILFLLNKFFFKKIGATLDTRHDVIKRGLDQAQEGEAILLTAEEEKASILKQAFKEKEAILAKGQTLADDLVKRKEDEAQIKIDARLTTLEEEEASLSDSVLHAFNKKAPALVVALYKKTLMKEMNEDENNALIARMSV